MYLELAVPNGLRSTDDVGCDPSAACGDGTLGTMN